MQQFAVFSVEDVEEAVLRGLEEHLAQRAIHLQVQQRDVLGGIEVPVVARGRLVEPIHAPAMRVQRQDAA